MDLMELLKQHQIALINQQRRPDQPMGSAFCMVEHYARRIKNARKDLAVWEY